MRLAPAFVAVACLSGLAACDPGYSFTIHNPCDSIMTIDYGDSDESDHRLTRDAVTIAPRATSSWTDLDDDINPPFGVLLLNGPREGERIKSEMPEVTIPESACPLRPTDGPLPVQYTVALLSDAEGHARVRYREPDGTMTTERVILPWRSDILVFQIGDLLVLEAKTLGDLGPGQIAPLQCEALIDPGNPEGKAAGSSRANMCDVRIRARVTGGFSFPD